MGLYSFYFQAGILRRHFRDGGPIRVRASVRDRMQIVIPKQAGQGHGYGGFLRGLEREAHIFQAERQAKTCWLESAIGDDAAVVRIDRRVENPILNFEKL